MLRSTKVLFGYAVEGKGAGLGTVHDLYFDDQEWKIRYLVVDTGGFLPGRKVLIPSTGLEEADWAHRVFRVNLTRDQIENSPGIDTDKPVSRQEEERLCRYFQWIPYWAPQGLDPVPHPLAFPPTPEPDEDGGASEEKNDPHLRSIREITGYGVNAKDGAIGHIDDFIVEDADWLLRMVIIDTRNWLPGKHVLLAIEWIGHIDWAEKRVGFDLNRATIEDAPAFDPSEPVNKSIEVRLYDYYGRPGDQATKSSQR